MKRIKTHYLIDYENVNSEGLSGCEKLGKTDRIVIFFTQNARKIDMSEIANHGEAELAMIEIPAGKQSADIHIGSYLGYLAGKSEGKECRAVIVSKDTDFDKLIMFWKEKMGFCVSRAQQIKDAPLESSVPAEDKAEADAEIKKLMNQAGYPEDITAHIAAIVVKNINNKNRKQQIYRSIISKYGQEKGLEIYNQVRKQL